MGHLSHKTILLAAVVALVALLLPGAVPAQSEEENEEYRFFISGSFERVESPSLTTITKEQIEAMDAHTVYGILGCVLGLFRTSSGMAFASYGASRGIKPDFGRKPTETKSVGFAQQFNYRPLLRPV